MMRLLSVAMIALAVAFVSSAATPSLKDVLTPDEFMRAGLEKLTAEELAFLSARLLPAVTDNKAAAVQTVVVPRGEAAFGNEEQTQRAVERQQVKPRKIESRVTGRFTGWSGHTTFSLANGQTWVQAEPGEFVVTLESPRVTIRAGLLGVYYLGVEGYGSETRVKRIK